jgi:cytochrome c-type biogenesis protein CcmH/NrfG
VPEDCVLASDEKRLIAEIGFLAADARNSKAAQAIFEGLVAISPDQPYPYIGLAMAKMSAGDPEAAVRILREKALPAYPDEEDIHVFLALALAEAKKPAECRKVLTAMLAVNKPDSAQRKLARALLNQLAASAGALAANTLPRPATAKALH